MARLMGWMMLMVDGLIWGWPWELMVVLLATGAACAAAGYLEERRWKK